MKPTIAASAILGVPGAVFLAIDMSYQLAAAVVVYGISTLFGSCFPINEIVVLAVRCHDIPCFYVYTIT